MARTLHFLATSLFVFLVFGCGIGTPLSELPLRLHLAPDPLRALRQWAPPLRVGPPSELTRMDCGFVTIQGAGIAADYGAAQLGGIDAACLQIGRVSAVVPESRLESPGVAISVAAGSARNVAVMVVTGTEAAGCGTTTVPGIFAPLRPAVYQAGSVVTDIFQGSSITVNSSYASATAVDLIAKCLGTSPNALRWTFVDGKQTAGLNRNPAVDAGFPFAAILGTKLYLAWQERNGAVLQIRVAVYNGNDRAPGWSFVDGNGANGINRDVTRAASFPQLTALDTKLYATWVENGGAGGTIPQVRVAVYNGNDGAPAWSFVDGNGAAGLNFAPGEAASVPRLVSHAGQLFATWIEPNVSVNQLRVARYNGNDGAPAWTFIDGNSSAGLNFDPGRSASAPQLVSFKAKLYAVWTESNGPTFQVRAAVWSGTPGTWNFVDGNGASGLNHNGADTVFPVQAAVVGAKLYLAWEERNATSGQVRAVVYNGNDTLPLWKFVDGNGQAGLNFDTGQDASDLQLAVSENVLFAMWSESAAGGVNQVRVRRYEGNDSTPVWSFVDGNGSQGLNFKPARAAGVPQILSLDRRLYGVWTEDSGTALQIRAVVGQ